MRKTYEIDDSIWNDILKRDDIIKKQDRLLKKALSALTMGCAALTNKDEEVVSTAIKLQKGVHEKIIRFMNSERVYENRE